MAKFPFRPKQPHAKRKTWMVIVGIIILVVGGAGAAWAATSHYKSQPVKPEVWQKPAQRLAHYKTTLSHQKKPKLIKETKGNRHVSTGKKPESTTRNQKIKKHDEAQQKSKENTVSSRTTRVDQSRTTTGHKSSPLKSHTVVDHQTTSTGNSKTETQPSSGKQSSTDHHSSTTSQKTKSDSSSSQPEEKTTMVKKSPDEKQSPSNNDSSSTTEAGKDSGTTSTKSGSTSDSSSGKHNDSNQTKGDHYDGSGIDPGKVVHFHDDKTTDASNRYK